MTQVKFTRRPFESFNSIVDDLMTELPLLVKNEIRPFQGKNFAPVNIWEGEKAYTLELAAPGFEKTDFNISLDQQVLTIAAGRKEGETPENRKQVRGEFLVRPFKRSFTIDEKIDTNNIEAAYVNGILTVNLPKVEIVKQTKEINIR
jgi:HSP20 family protein